MTTRRSVYITIVALVAIIAAAGCSDRDTGGLEPATGDDNPLVFTDGYAEGVTYQAFWNSKTDAVQIDGTEGTPRKPSLEVTVPAPSTEPPWFAGGAFTNVWARDLSGYNALTFYAKAEKSAILNVAGFANDNTGLSKYQGSVDSLYMTTEWRKFILPVPAPSKLTLERGLFFFAEGHENGLGYRFWFDEIKYETVAGITNPRAYMPTESRNVLVGDTLDVNCRTIFDFGDSTITVKHYPGQFTFTSSDPAVVSTETDRLIVIGPGETELTAKLGSRDVDGVLTISAAAVPTVAAPTPTEPSVDVISIYSDSYTDVPVGTFSPTWDLAEVADVEIAGNNTKKYTLFPYAAIEFGPVNAGTMTHFHIDFFAATGTNFIVKLVDFGADGMYGGSNENADSEEIVTIDDISTPPFAVGAWISLDIPLTEFTNGNLAATEHLAQMFLESDSHTVYIDNIYFYYQP